MAGAAIVAAPCSACLRHPSPPWRARLAWPPLPRLIAALLLAALAAAVVAAPTGAQDEGTLRSQIGAAKSRERSLAGAVARLGELERKTAAQVAILEGRVAAAQTELTLAENRLASTQKD